MLTERQEADARRTKRARLLVPGFKLWRHLTAFVGLAAAGIALGAWLARAATLADLWIVPIYLLIANVVEYLLHRFPMHRPLLPRALYVGHTLEHHRCFQYHSMEVESWSEMGLVMMPWFSIALLFAGLAPVVVVVAWALGPNPAGLLLGTAAFSFIFYEGLHALYHFPAPTLARLGLSRNRFFLFLARHHQHHHRLVRMRWVNFNISLPLSDVLFGTLESEEAWQAARAQRLATQGAEAGADDEDEQLEVVPRVRMGK